MTEAVVHGLLSYGRTCKGACVIKRRGRGDVSANPSTTLHHTGTLLIVLGLASAAVLGVLSEVTVPLVVVLVGVALVGVGFRVEATLRIVHQKRTRPKLEDA
ncbi:hypothetical protein [Nonomuraea endophytica]|uniref:hypothetical protein n=1 Tax=Nonomuraea endophytica TaxID=714136 RepID=UPI0037C6D4BE